MDFKKFKYQVNAEVTLTCKQIIHLLRCCKNHYDFKCRNAGLKGGLIYGWSIQLEPEGVKGQSVTVTVTIDQAMMLYEITQIESSCIPQLKMNESCKLLYFGMCTEQKRRDEKGFKKTEDENGFTTKTALV